MPSVLYRGAHAYWSSALLNSDQSIMFLGGESSENFSEISSNQAIAAAAAFSLDSGAYIWMKQYKTN